MVEVVQFRPVPKRETVTWLRWRWSGPKSLPDPFGGDYKWKFVHFDLTFDIYKCPPGVITFEITSLNQLVALQLPFPIRVRKKKFSLKKEKTTISNYMVIQQAFTRPSTKFSFDCIYRRNWAYEEGVRRAVLNYTITVRENKEARVSGPHQIVIPLVSEEKPAEKASKGVTDTRA